MSKVEQALFYLGLRYNWLPNTIRNKTISLIGHDRILFEVTK